MTTIAIAIVGRAITLEREPSKKRQRTNTKKDAKRIKSDNFTRSNNIGAPKISKKTDFGCYQSLNFYKVKIANFNFSLLLPI